MPYENVVTLTGAGLSVDYGGFLASEVWGRLLACPEIRETSLSRLFVEIQDFEKIVEIVRERSSSSSEDELGRLESALLSVFRSMNLLERIHVVENKAYKIRDIFQLSGDHTVFTLNQDLLVEMICHHMNVKLLRPNLDVFCGWKTIDEGLGNLYENYNSVSTVVPVQCDSSHQIIDPPDCFKYVKLHGSCDWFDEQTGRSLIVVGAGKGSQCKDSALLFSYQKMLAEAMSQNHTMLLVIGYSFRDPHINNIIANACRTNKIGVFIWDLCPPESMLRNMKGLWNEASGELYDVSQILSSLVGYLPRSVKAVVEPPVGYADWSIRDILKDADLIV